MPGGINISMGEANIKIGKMVRRKIEYEITIIDKEPKKPFKVGLFFNQIGILFANFLKGNSVSKSPLSQSYTQRLQPFTDKLTVSARSATSPVDSENASASPLRCANAQNRQPV